MNYPIGIKLNTQLSSFLGLLFLSLNSIWSTITKQLLNQLGIILTIASVCCLLGLSVGLAFLSDMLDLLTVHLYIFHRMSSRMYYWQYNAIKTLYHLFRGKKRNVVKNRIDSESFELDQLLLGTIFFVILIFLYPTFLSFYFVFLVVGLSTSIQ